MKLEEHYIHLITFFTNRSS